MRKLGTITAWLRAYARKREGWGERNENGDLLVNLYDTNSLVVVLSLITAFIRLHVHGPHP